MTEDISRDEVIERVKRGQMTPDQAEAWAANKGTQPFAEPRTIQHFDPLQEVYWSLRWWPLGSFGGILRQF